MAADEIAPQDTDAEDALLGACILNPKAADRVVETVDPAWFYRESNGTILAAIASLRQRGVEAEPVSLAGELSASSPNGEWSLRVHALAALAPGTRNIDHWVGLVRDAYARRQAIRILGTYANEAFTGMSAAEALEGLDRARSDLELVVNRRQADTPLEALLDRALDTLEHPPVEAGGVPVPFWFLQPMQPGRMYILGGYAKDGKSVLASQFAQAACEAGKRVGFVSIEMSGEDLVGRFISSLGAIPYARVQTAEYLPHERDTVRVVLERMRPWQMRVNDSSYVTPEMITAWQRRHRFELLIIDHLHLIDWEDRRQFERNVASIAELARSERIPVLMLAQLARRANDSYPRPSMNTLRESGMIEANASHVWFVWRKRDEANVQTTDTEFIVAASRYTHPGRWSLEFVPEQVRFEAKGESNGL